MALWHAMWTRKVTPKRTSHAETLMVAQLIKLFRTAYGTRGFVTVFTTAHDWSLPDARQIHSTLSCSISVWSMALLDLLSYLPSGYPHTPLLSYFSTKCSYTLLISSVHATWFTFFIPFHFILTVYGEQHKSWSTIRPTQFSPVSC
jgi:hypothetical protein